MPFKDPQKAKESTLAWRRRNREKYLATSARYRGLHVEQRRTAAKDYYERIKNTPEYKQRVAEYCSWKKANKPDVLREYGRRSYRKHAAKRQEWRRRFYDGSDKAKAHRRVRTMVAGGKLPSVKTMNCINCLGPASQYHHHRGYSKEHWLDVVPVCNGCHKRVDKIDKERMRAEAGR